MGGNLHLLCGHLSHVHISSEDVPAHHSCSRKGALMGAGVGPWHFQEGVIVQHCPRAALKPPPSCSKVTQLSHLLNLCLMKHSQCGDPPSVLQAALHCWFGCSCCIYLPLLLLLLLPLLLPLLPQLLVSFARHIFEVTVNL